MRSRQAGFFSIAAIAAASALTVCSSISTQARAPLLPILTESTYLQDVENESAKALHEPYELLSSSSARFLASMAVPFFGPFACHLIVL